jgi:hypothetical protein
MKSKESVLLPPLLLEALLSSSFARLPVGVHELLSLYQASLLFAPFFWLWLLLLNFSSSFSDLVW